MARPQRITDDTIIEALAAGGEVTAAEVAVRVGIGQSTAAKRLAALGASGSVRRDPGGRVNGVRVPDRWSVAHVFGGDDDLADRAAEPDPESDSTPTEPAGNAATSGGERLGRGALEGLVREYLAGHPSVELGPTQVGKALGRSQGAVSNALARLEAAGEARLVSASPRRYLIVAKR